MAALRRALEWLVGRVLGRFEIEEPDNETTLLANFDELRRQGKLTYEEFREIQITLAEQMEVRREKAKQNREEDR